MNMRTALAWCLALLVACLAGQGPVHAAERRAAVPGELAVKTAFVYNFIKFVEWPQSAVRAKTLRLCVLGGEEPAALFSELNGQEIMGMQLAVSPVQDPREAVACTILFVTADQALRLPTVLDAVAGHPTLTIGDTAGFGRQGIMINLYIENKRVRFEINVERARSAGLRISTKLLNLAGKVYGAAQAGE
jgi:hypothetical protein